MRQTSSSKHTNENVLNNGKDWQRVGDLTLTVESTEAEQSSRSSVEHWQHKTSLLCPRKHFNSVSFTNDQSCKKKKVRLI